MANNMADGTGSLMLVRRTPIINAFFGAMLGEEPPVTGDVREDDLRQSTESIEPATWETIRKNLIDNLHDSLESPEDATLADCLRVLMARHGRNDQWLLNLLDASKDEDDSTADFALCFDLAEAFDDGHGLVSMSMEVAYTCSRMLSGQFGGSGEYVSKNVCCYGGSSSPIMRGQQIESAITKNDGTALEKIICEAVDTLLGEIRSADLQDVVRGQLLVHLARHR